MSWMAPGVGWLTKNREAREQHNLMARSDPLKLGDHTGTGFRFKLVY